LNQGFFRAHRRRSTQSPEPESVASGRICHLDSNESPAGKVVRSPRVLGLFGLCGHLNGEGGTSCTACQHNEATHAASDRPRYHNIGEILGSGLSGTRRIVEARLCTAALDVIA
jgi:hypothetical protein